MHLFAAIYFPQLQLLAPPVRIKSILDAFLKPQGGQTSLWRDFLLVRVLATLNDVVMTTSFPWSSTTASDAVCVVSQLSLNFLALQDVLGHNRPGSTPHCNSAIQNFSTPLCEYNTISNMQKTQQTTPQQYDRQDW